MKTLDRILLIDDDAVTSFYHKIVLERLQASREILLFETGKEALKYLSEARERVDLIFLDINMPLMNGWQFLDHFDNLNVNEDSNIPIVMVTSSANSVDKVKAETHKYIRKFVNKPLCEEKVQEILNSLG